MLVAFILGILNSMLISNVTLSRFYGICPFLGVSKKPKTAFSMGLAVVLVIFISTIVTYPLYKYILVPTDTKYLSIICNILVIASIVQILEMFIKRFSKSIYNSLGVYLPLITTNCAVLGVVTENLSQDNLSFINSISNALGTSLGFLLVIVLFSTIRIRLESCNVPKCLKNIPIALICAFIMAIAFMGISGVI